MCVCAPALPLPVLGHALHSSVPESQPSPAIGLKRCSVAAGFQRNVVVSR